LPALWYCFKNSFNLKISTNFNHSTLKCFQVFALDSDDYDGKKCGEGTYPLTREIKATLNQQKYKLEFVKMASEVDKWIMFGEKEAAKRKRKH
jgi:hypothetical protein